jgi:hypothetical protein
MDSSRGFYAGREGWVVCALRRGAVVCPASLLACALAAGCGPGVSSAIPSAGSKAAPGEPGGAILGYAWSASDATLRPMLGVIGSGLVGQSIVPAGTYVAGAATSASEIGLVEDEAGSLYLLNLPTPTVTQIATGLSGAAQISFAPSGGRAVVYVAGGTSVMAISGLTGQTDVTTLAVPTGMVLGSAIVSDAGTVLAAVQGSPVRIGTLAAGGRFSQRATVSQMGGMSFLAGLDDALVADAASNAVLRLSGVSAAFSIQALGNAGVSQPLAVAASQDGHWGLVVNGGDQNVVRVDLTSGIPNTKIACACQPTQALALHGGKAFRLNEGNGGPVWIADLSAVAPRMLFVPALP